MRIETGAQKKGAANETLNDDTTSEEPNLKTGVKLPKTPEQWDEANNYFRVNLPCENVQQSSLDDVVKNFNNTVYSYFKDNYGTVKDKILNDETLRQRYDGMSKSQLKREIKPILIILSDRLLKISLSFFGF